MTSELQNPLPTMSNAWILEQINDRPEPPTPVLASSKIPLCALYIAEIVIGAVYLNECPRQRYIPIYLIVLGAFSLVLMLLSCLPCAKEPEDGSTNPLSQICITWNSLITCFLFCWFIAGNVWIYSIYEPNYDKSTTDMDPYCDKTLYLFAFWVTTVVYILIGLFIVFGCCTLVCALICTLPACCTV